MPGPSMLGYHVAKVSVGELRVEWIINWLKCTSLILFVCHCLVGSAFFGTRVLLFILPLW